MNYKETLFFVAKCLTISTEEKNKIIVEKQLKEKSINWEKVVQLSTEHYVFPALYCNLKRVDFLHYLPEDLVEYMEHITHLNRERNLQIIEQAKEINSLLLKNNITPIFLKGTGNLLEGLYDDIAERMVGDIDFIVSEIDYKKACDTLLSFNYESTAKENYHLPLFKHFPRIKNKNKIAAVEVHKELIIEKYAHEFNYSTISNSLYKIKNFHFLSFENQLSLSILAKQINDNGFIFGDIALRNAYDVYLISKKIDTLNVVVNFNELFNPINNFLAICNFTFGNINTIKFKNNKITEKSLKTFESLLIENCITKKIYQRKNLKLYLDDRFKIIKKTFYNKDYRYWLFKRLTDKNWQSEKLIQLGLKKPKPNS